MSDVDSDFTGSIPDIYDSHLVPILFEGYADDLARRVVRHTPTAVLEIAAGSGAVTRVLAPRLGRNTRYVVTDINGAMLERARRRQPDYDEIEWQEANALSLPFEDNSFDVVLCQFGVMFFPDHVAGFSEARRVLRPGGRFLFNSWGAIEKNDFSNITTQTVISLYTEDPPLFLARTPFGYTEKPRIEADLATAGFADINIEEVEKTSHAEKADDFAFGQLFGSPLSLEVNARGEPSIDEVREAIEAALVKQFGSGPINGGLAAMVTEAVAP